MIRPPRGFCSFMILNASCVHRNAPVRLVSTTAFHCATVRSSRSPAAPMPALLNRRSRRPNVSLVRANRARIASGSHTSVGTTSVRPLDAPAAATCSSASLRRPASDTWYPSFNSASATALPTPLPAPVTIATFLSMVSLLIAWYTSPTAYHGRPHGPDRVRGGDVARALPRLLRRERGPARPEDGGGADRGGARHGAHAGRGRARRAGRRRRRSPQRVLVRRGARALRARRALREPHGPGRRDRVRPGARRVARALPRPRGPGQRDPGTGAAGRLRLRRVVVGAARPRVPEPGLDALRRSPGAAARPVLGQLPGAARRREPGARPRPLLRRDGADRPGRARVGRGMSRYDTNVILYRLKKDPAFRDRFRSDPAGALAAADLTDDERHAFVRWDVRRLNELGGMLHLLLSIPGLGH